MLVAKGRISTRDKNGELKTFEVGEEIKGLTKKDSSSLMKLGLVIEQTTTVGEDDNGNEE